jgi:hypothetical protein
MLKSKRFCLGGFSFAGRRRAGLGAGGMLVAFFKEVLEESPCKARYRSSQSAAQWAQKFTTGLEQALIGHPVNHGRQAAGVMNSYALFADWTYKPTVPLPRRQVGDEPRR